MEMQISRPPAVAGMFYPGDPRILAGEVDTMLARARAVSPAPAFGQPKALIAPHAGYIYSGPIAASAYASLLPYAQVIRRVVLLGPCHRVAIRGLAVPHAQSFSTPLGAVALDQAAIAAALELPQVIRHNGAHADEHSLEVHLPFLQATLEDFTLVPFAVGYASAEEVAEVLELLWGGPETLIVVSSDLSHYHPYSAAQRLDAHTANEILHLDLLRDHEQACGATPINGLIEVAKRHGLVPHLLDLRNSGDTAGDKAQVVGYASFAFTEPEHA
ncbi:AmmeMemoRadiSam system protein B [Sulfuricystis multivorans]|uniref:AmmeMemoRadiSam system protein B n=1 Tax=Sulfuricystis multivorans TaxID=2211108 RepID=UPI0024DF9105|nr:AmmeMemoRadiSam system protein B [Sulfuricystis multivorans]